MPELPELQAHAERLQTAYKGAALAEFLPLMFTVLKTVEPPTSAANGKRLTSAKRRGKFLLLVFDELSFVVHLMQGGRLQPDLRDAPRPRKGMARWRFDDGRSLLLSEAGNERRAGVWIVEGDAQQSDPIQRLGPDVDQIGLDELMVLLAGASMQLHRFLRDQRLVAGLGRRLANEICFRAQLSPYSNTAKLTQNEAERLHQAIGACIAESLTFERARDNMSASNERPGAVHNRVGTPCPVCGDVIRAVTFSRYSISYCATCQTGGKVLADNTTSRFLK
ncbi:MAG: hypothetical protein N2037_03310 [Acidimicrobiales bacterium]|nr:hypothetical protein [Acidimicrobiales bacterium]